MVLDAKAEVMGVLGSHNLIVAGAAEPVWTGVTPRKEEGLSMLIETSKLGSVESLAHSKEMTDIFERIVGGPVHVFKEKVPRFQIPEQSSQKYGSKGEGLHGTVAAPLHQDIHDFPGSPEFYVGWVPLMDIDETTGGLTLAANSHRLGYNESLYEINPKMGTPSIPDDRLDATWLRRDYHVGDLLVFGCMMAHKALPNWSNRVRLSVDFRYQLGTAKMDWRADFSLEDFNNYKERVVRPAVIEAGADGLDAEKVVWKIAIEGGAVTRDRVKKTMKILGVDR